MSYKDIIAINSNNELTIYKYFSYKIYDELAAKIRDEIMGAEDAMIYKILDSIGEFSNDRNFWR